MLWAMGPALKNTDITKHLVVVRWNETRDPKSRRQCLTALFQLTQAVHRRRSLTLKAHV